MTEAPLIFLVGILACWRAAVLITTDEGPFGLFVGIRDRIDPEQKTWVGRGLNCEWCVSFWAALAYTLWLYAFGFLGPELIPVWWFGTAGGAAFVQVLHVWTLKRR